MQIKIDKKFKKNVQGMFGRYQFDVGVLEDKPHKLPMRDVKKGREATIGSLLKNYAGGPASKVSNQNSGLMISEVSAEFRSNLGVNYLTAPFKKRSSEIIKFSNEFFKLVFGKSEKKRAENLLQAVVRNPILRGDYGRNTKVTQIVKGFERLGIDTAQLFKAIRAKCTVGVKRV